MLPIITVTGPSQYSLPGYRPTSTGRPSDNVQRPQHVRDSQRPSDHRDEPRDFESQVSDDDRNYNAPFDSNVEPIEDEDINTHGSER